MPWWLQVAFVFLAGLGKGWFLRGLVAPGGRYHLATEARSHEVELGPPPRAGEALDGSFEPTGTGIELERPPPGATLEDGDFYDGRARYL